MITNDPREPQPQQNPTTALIAIIAIPILLGLFVLLAGCDQVTSALPAGTDTAKVVDSIQKAHLPGSRAWQICGTGTRAKAACAGCSTTPFSWSVDFTTSLDSTISIVADSGACVSIGTLPDSAILSLSSWGTQGTMDAIWFTTASDSGSYFPVTWGSHRMDLITMARIADSVLDMPSQGLYNRPAGK